MTNPEPCHCGEYSIGHFHPDGKARPMSAMFEVQGLRAENAALLVRRDELLALVARLSQTTPLASEIEGWEAQRSALIAEVGSLRAKLAEAERRNASLEDAVIDGARTIEGWVTLETQYPNKEDDPDWQQAERLRSLVSKGQTK